MNKIKINILGPLLKPNGKESFEYICPKGTTIKDLLINLKYDPKHIKFIVSSVNDIHRNHDYILEDNDNLSLSTIIGGG